MCPHCGGILQNWGYMSMLLVIFEQAAQCLVVNASQLRALSYREHLEHCDENFVSIGGQASCSGHAGGLGRMEARTPLWGKYHAMGPAL